LGFPGEPNPFGALQKKLGAAKDKPAQSRR
jgi:hypothetical protein